MNTHRPLRFYKSRAIIYLEYIEGIILSIRSIAEHDQRCSRLLQ